MAGGAGRSVQVTLGSASDGHCAPPSFAGACRVGTDEGPVLKDAQRQVIPFEGTASVPMATEGGE
eukprot:11155550-Lingulodinium_polyedra.AAC.1